MGRGHRGSRSDTELKEIQRIRLENNKLKKQISKLRKELSRIDIDRYSSLKTLIEAQAAEDESFDSVAELEQLKTKWMCHKCQLDHMRLILIPRADGTFYLRKCGTCDNRTKMKKYVDGIEGIMSNDNPL
jgi:hypothetical protein